MGIPYELFLWVFAAGNFCFGILSQADRLARATLRSLAFGQDGAGLWLRALSLLGSLAWIALLAIGLLSLRWYLALVLTFLPGAAGGLLYSLLVNPRRFLGSPVHHLVAGIAGAAVAGIALFLWAQRFLH